MKDFWQLLNDILIPEQNEYEEEIDDRKSVGSIKEINVVNNIPEQNEYEEEVDDRKSISPIEKIHVVNNSAEYIPKAEVAELIPVVNAIPEEVVVPRQPRVNPIHLSGQALFNDLLKDIKIVIEGDQNDHNNHSDHKVTLTNKLTERFIRSIDSSITGMGRNQEELASAASDILNKLRAKFSTNDVLKALLDQQNISDIQKLQSIDEHAEGDAAWKEIGEYIKSYDRKFFEQQAVISEVEKERLKTLVSEASAKLINEIDRENQSSIYWKYTNSVDRAAQKRHMLNFVGHIYDAIGSMSHSISKIIGLSNPNAAEIFDQAAKYAQEVKYGLERTQIIKNEKNAIEGEKNVQFYELKQRGKKDQRIPEDIKKEVEEHKKRAFLQSAQKLLDQVGYDTALKAQALGSHGSKESQDPEKVQMRESFKLLYNSLKSERNKGKLQKTEVHVAMADAEMVLFPDDLVIGGKVYPVKLEKEKISTVIERLEQCVKEIDNHTITKAFEDFKTQVDVYAPKKTWAQRIGISGLSGRERS